jgi:hypothetical protein
VPDQSNGLLRAAMNPRARAGLHRGSSFVRFASAVSLATSCLSTTRGKKVPIVDLVTDKVREVEIFVGVGLETGGVGTVDSSLRYHDYRELHLRWTARSDIRPDFSQQFGC